jgi:DNA gyrase inhibitor GyrI
MLLIASSDPSPLVQAAVYMGGMLAGYALLVRPDEWQSAWETLRNTWTKRSED